MVWKEFNGGIDLRLTKVLDIKHFIISVEFKRIWMNKKRRKIEGKKCTDLKEQAGRKDVKKTKA